MKEEAGNVEDGAAEVIGGKRGNKREGDGQESRGEGENQRLNESLIHLRDRRREGWWGNAQ